MFNENLSYKLTNKIYFCKNNYEVHLRKLSELLADNKFGKGGAKWTEKEFTNLFKKHALNGRPGTSITDEFGETNIVGRTLSAEELLDVLIVARQSPKPGMEKVLAELANNTNLKYIGSEYVLRYAKDNWNIISSFEEKVQNGARIIDIVAINKPLRREMKSWRAFSTKYRPGFLKELVEDLKGINSMDEMGWFFDKKGDFVKDETYLKDNVMDALRSIEGKEYLKSISAAKANQLLERTDLRDATELQREKISEVLISYFDDAGNFNKIFK